MTQDKEASKEEDSRKKTALPIGTCVLFICYLVTITARIWYLGYEQVRVGQYNILEHSLGHLSDPKVLILLVPLLLSPLVLYLAYHRSKLSAGCAGLPILYALMIHGMFDIGHNQPSLIYRIGLITTLLISLGFVYYFAYRLVKSPLEARVFDSVKLPTAYRAIVWYLGVPLAALWSLAILFNIANMAIKPQLPPYLLKQMLFLTNFVGVPGVALVLLGVRVRSGSRIAAIFTIFISILLTTGGLFLLIQGRMLEWEFYLVAGFSLQALVTAYRTASILPILNRSKESHQPA